jgi:hypothetical protein
VGVVHDDSTRACGRPYPTALLRGVVATDDDDRKIHEEGGRLGTHGQSTRAPS